MMKASALTAMLLASLPCGGAAQRSGLDTLTPPVQTRVTCSLQAATRFAVPANLLIAIAEQEGGSIGQWVKNANGSYDVGPMQFNTAYLRSLERFGITPDDVAAPGCYPYELAAWRLRRHLHLDRGDLWKRAANYHSGTPDRNARYRERLRARAAKWGQWLAEHVPAAEVAKLEASTISESSYVHEPPPTPPSRSSQDRVVTTFIERRAPRRHAHSPKAPARKAAPNSRHAASMLAEPTPATKRHLLEELANLDAGRRARLLEHVSGPQPLGNQLH